MEIYLYSRCTSCKKAEALLAHSGRAYTRRDYFKDPFTADELVALLDRAGVTVGEVLSTRSRAYADLGLAERQLSDVELLELMVEEPRLLRRPLILGGGKTVIGFNQAAVADLIDRA